MKVLQRSRDFLWRSKVLVKAVVVVVNGNARRKQNTRNAEP
jgi:hypothetical protein